MARDEEHGKSGGSFHFDEPVKLVWGITTFDEGWPEAVERAREIYREFKESRTSQEAPAAPASKEPSER